jgi:hypothetical protein
VLGEELQIGASPSRNTSTNDSRQLYWQRFVSLPLARPFFPFLFRVAMVIQDPAGVGASVAIVSAQLI